MVRAVPKAFETLNSVDKDFTRVDSGKLADNQNDLLILTTVLMVSMRLLTDSFSITFNLIASLLVSIGAVVGLVCLND